MRQRRRGVAAPASSRPPATRSSGPREISRQERALRLIESHDPSERMAGLKTILYDPSALRVTAVYSSHNDVRTAALDRLSEDIEALSHVIKNSPFEDTKASAERRLRAYFKLADKDVLLELARESRSERFRTAAVEALKERGDKDTLGYIAVSSLFDDTKKLALGYL